MPVGQYAVVSDAGRRRRRNEDNYVVAPPLFAVADGMGGAQAGEVASGLAAAALKDGSTEADALQRVDALIQEANRRIYERASTDPSASGMGTTMTVSVVLGHVGDSRAYLVRGDTMEQLTEDHSLVNELLKSGKLSQEEAQIHPQRSVITRAVGTDPDVDVDVFTIEAEDGDVFLLCSDGLTDMVEDVDILDLVDRNRGDLEKAVRELVQCANKEGGDDNITAVAFRIAAADEPVGEETVTMPAVDGSDDPATPGEPDERTPESVDVPALPPQAATSGGPEISGRRVGLVLAALILIAAAAALIIWWRLSR
jgi:protein phosphatase